MPRKARGPKRTRSASVRARRYTRARPRKTFGNKKMLVLGRGFPKKMMVTHRYCDQITLTSTAGVMATYQWKCNGMYDPNATGGGHQPLLFDQLTPLYNHYQVVGSKMKIRIVPHTSNTVTSNFACFVNDDTAFENTGIDGTAEQVGATATLIGTVAGGNRPITKTLFWSSKKYFGTKELENSRLQGTSSTDPTELSFYSLCLQAFDQTNSCQLQIFVEIDYTAIWTELKDVDQS